jgi:hypothetical protein
LDVGREEKKNRSQKDNQKASEITPMALHNDTSSSVYLILIKASSRGVVRWGCPIVHLLAKGGSPVRFYTKKHRHYCGIDPHARSMYICIVDEDGETLLHGNCKATPEAFLRAIAPYREDVVAVVECMFVWYWLADVCANEKIPFVLGHAR